MSKKLTTLLGLLVLASMLLSACQPVTTPTVPAEEEAPAQQEATVAPEVEAEAPVEEPTPEPAVEDSMGGGYLDRIIFTRIEEVGPAVEQLQADAIDMYAVAADDAIVFDTVKADSNMKYAMTYGSSNQLLFNPAACTDTAKLNPFTSAKIREAMNWATDRNYIAEELMQGLAVPKFTSATTAFPDYARYAGLFSEIETKYAYDLEKARAVVDEEMVALGAEKGADGKWTYQGNPVVIVGLIRTEDARREIGNYFANQLEELGFTVERQEKNRSDAGPIWQEGDPKACEWTYYTAGWISPSISRDDGYQFAQYNTNRMQNLPVFGEYNPGPELAAAEDKLFVNDFTTMEERAELFRTAAFKSMEESWWGVFVTDNISYSPYNQNLVSAYDLASGFASAQLWPYTIRWADKEGGEVRIAQSGILVQPWNPIAGSNWTDDAMIQRATMDWGTVYDPYTGLYLPKLVERAELVAKEGLPIASTLDWVDLSFESDIQVPEDAWVDWDAAEQRFITAAEKYPEGLTTNTKATVYYLPEVFDSTWHDGSKLAVSDFVMTMIMAFDHGKPESKVYDETLVNGVETYLSHFRGVRIVSTDPLVIETYDDSYALDAENNIATWFPSTYYPANSTNGMIAWQNMAPALMAEEAGELAISIEKSGTNEVEWTSFIAGPALEIEARYLDQAIADAYIPYAPTLSQYITAEEAVARYENLKAFYTEKGHMMVGTGPYVVDQVFPVEGTVTLVRNETYPFSLDQWAVYDEPHLATTEVEGALQVVKGEEAAFDVYINFKDEPYANDDIASVSYTLYGANGETVSTGVAEAVSDGLDQVIIPADVTSQMEAGAAKLAIAVSSKIVSIPSFTSYEFVVAE